MNNIVIVCVMFIQFRRFKKNESGATTTEWVILAAAVAAIGIAVYLVVSSGVFSKSDEVSADISSGLIEEEAELVEQAPSAPLVSAVQDHTNWDDANVAINNCLSRSGTPETAPDARTNPDGSPSQINCSN